MGAIGADVTYICLFRFLIADVDGAKADLLASIDILPSFTQSWVKVASVYMEQDDSKRAFECFEKAIEQNPNDPDTYYHRGQGAHLSSSGRNPRQRASFIPVFFIMKEFAKAAENYTKCIELDDSFVCSHIQLAVAQYKQGNLAKSMATFRRTLKAFPKRSEPQNY